MLFSRRTVFFNIAGSISVFVDLLPIVKLDIPISDFLIVPVDSLFVEAPAPPL